MAYDFRTEGLRAQRLIASGSGVKDIGLLIYSSSNASNFQGTRQSALTQRLVSAGKDVWLYVDGVPSNDPRFNHNRHQQDANKVVLFKGDVVVSGTLHATTFVARVDENVSGSLHVPNDLFVSGTAVLNNARSADNDFIVRSQNRSHAIFVDSSNSRVGIGFGVEETNTLKKDFSDYSSDDDLYSDSSDDDINYNDISYEGTYMGISKKFIGICNFDSRIYKKIAREKKLAKKKLAKKKLAKKK